MTLRTHIDGSVFAEHLTGSGPRLLALHGWGRDRSDLLPALVGRDLVAVDLPGFGASPPPPHAWGAADYADAVATMLRDLDGGPVLVVGHSFGGRVAAHLAAAHPDLVSGVVFVGVPLLRQAASNKPAPLYRAVRAAHRMHLVPESTMERMRQRYGSRDYNAASGRMREVFVRVVAEDYREQLQQCDCPAAFCWGANDTAAPPAIAREAATLVRHLVRLDILDGVGHDVHRDAPEALISAIDAVAQAAR